MSNFEKDRFRKQSLTKEVLNILFSVIFHLGARSAVYQSRMDCCRRCQVKTKFKQNRIFFLSAVL